MLMWRHLGGRLRREGGTVHWTAVTPRANNLLVLLLARVAGGCLLSHHHPAGHLSGNGLLHSGRTRA